MGTSTLLQVKKRKGCLLTNAGGKARVFAEGGSFCSANADCGRNRNVKVPIPLEGGG